MIIDKGLIVGVASMYSIIVVMFLFFTCYFCFTHYEYLRNLVMCATRICSVNFALPSLHVVLEFSLLGQAE